MPQRTKLTDTGIRNLSVTQRTTYWDAVVPGLGVRVTPKGTKSFVVFIGSGKRRVIGKYPLMRLAEAREQARALLAEKTLGIPQPTRTSHSVAVQQFLEECARKNRAKTVYDYRNALNRLDFSKPVGDITARDILTKLETLSDTPRMQGLVFSVARAYFNWCLRQQLITAHPMQHMKAPAQPGSRERVLSQHELARVYQAAQRQASTFHRIVLFLILTGQRRGETAALRHEWITDDALTFPGSVTKNGREHTIPLTETVAELVQPHVEGYVFPGRNGPFNGWSKSLERFRKETGVAFRLHDIRRTMSSGLASLGVDQLVTEKLLNHLTGSQSEIARVYNRYSYLPEMREALDLWQDHLHTLSSELVT